VVADGDLGEFDGGLVAQVDRCRGDLGRPGRGELLGSFAGWELCLDGVTASRRGQVGGLVLVWRQVATDAWFTSDGPCS
jgi:hypothetical protein